MLAVIIQACLIASPSTCQEHRIPVLSGGNTYRCAMLAPVKFANWAQEHPELKIKSWRCGVMTDDTQ